MADGYARASGRVGVAIATSGPGATNMVTGIATAMLDSAPIVCITGQVGSGLIGTDAFQEVDITGITLPITKHNYLVTRAEDVGPALREAFHIARTGRPGPVLVDITKDAQQGSADFDWDAAAPRLPGYRPPAPPDPADCARALELLNMAERPLILAGHGVQLAGAEAALARARRARRHPGRHDAARHRRLPGLAPAEPRHGGHARRVLGQPRRAGGRPARRARHALRRPRDRQPEDVRARRPQDPRRHRPGRDRQERARGRRPRRRPRRGPRGAAAGRAAGGPHALALAHPRRSRATRRSATSSSFPTTATCTPRT